MQWRKKKEEMEVNKCGLVLHAQNQNSQWYVDSGCSRHIIGDKSKFVPLDENKQEELGERV